MPNQVNLPTRRHSQFRRVSVTIDYVFFNYNPPHVWDCTDKNLEERLQTLFYKNAMKTLPLQGNMQVGFLNPDFIKDWSSLEISVKARECGDNGKPLSLWERIKYLLTGRYWR